MKKLLDVKNLKVSFHTYAGEVKAVRGISFDLDEGETLAIVGESGSGKSITAKSIMKLLPKDISDIKEDSEIDFNGTNVLKLSDKELQKVRGREIGMIFQDPMTSLNPTMKIGKQIEEVLKIHRGLNKLESKEEIIRLLKLVNIPNPEKRLNQYPFEFSGGMRQRMMIAMALACRPKVLIADEPTTALDVTIQAQIMDLIDKLKVQMGTAVILITHDLGVVFEHADKIQVMYAGVIVERGTVKDIFKNAKHPYTWALLKSMPTLDTEHKGELYSISGTPPDLLNPPTGCPFAARCEYAMEVCKEQRPEETVISDTHKVDCWLMHEYAPKVKSPLEEV
ncbi:MAG: ABC transporter ATP-binding protein [Clostridium chrysemydis]|uniref:ABC transporter ATP-binding protein n=1 Tax=Clostridium TaxID=1485 RepID=UPI002152E949|nr:ABC transporter ATP-binding protein [Clostridium sp. LY3-2]MCR6513702.1 ABC transporter ATP-binding protein [Clostridium sp. LY3-2]